MYVEKRNIPLEDYFRKLSILSSDEMLVLLDNPAEPKKRLRKIAYKLKKCIENKS